jgi:HD-GYP domain-containing protein (c-di-GMP phosphodiesterase class II)
MDTAAEGWMHRVLGGEDEERLLNAFFVLYRNARVIAPDNSTFQRQAENLQAAIRAVGGGTCEVDIKLVAGRYFVNEKMVRHNEHGPSGSVSVVEEWRRLGVAGVEFAARVRLRDITGFFSFMADVRPHEDNLQVLSQRLKDLQIDRIRLLSAVEAGAELEEASRDLRHHFRTAARTTFFRALSVVKEAVSGTCEGSGAHVSRTKRVVRSLIEHISRDESSMFELTAIKSFDDYTYAHSLNVCVYALTLGLHLGLDRARLSQLGFAALFHDVGKGRLPVDLIRKPEAFDENDWVQMQTHPLLGAKTILRHLKLDAHSARAALGAFEHHINYDLTGYPTLRHELRMTNLFSRVVSVVDTFDALTSGRVYHKRPIPPDEVLRKMHYQMTSKFDPFLLRVFNDIVGVYPAGSLVLLSTDEIALVLTNSEADRTRPYIKIVGNREGLLERPDWVDLALPEQAHRQIVRLIDPSRYGLDIKDFVLYD